MYCRVLACDFDGTGALDGRLSPEDAEALGAARERKDLAIANVDPAVFDAVVAEHGAVVRLPRRDQTIRIAEPPPERLLTAGWARDVLGDEPLAAGLTKVEENARTSGRVNPIEVLRHVRHRYV
jgi:hypothetical protein